MELAQARSPDVNAQAKNISKRILQLLESELERVISSHLLVDATGLSDPQLRLEGVLIDGRQSQGLGYEVISRRISLVCCYQWIFTILALRVTFPPLGCGE
jgi:hypothetical protein